MPSPQTVIENALREIGALGAAQSISAEDLELGRQYYNMLLGRWATRKRYAWYIRNQAFTFATSAQSYTFGPSGNFTPSSPAVDTRPQRIERVKLVLTSSNPDSEYELPILNVDSYADLGMPALSATLPERVYYEPQTPNGRLYPWPYPTDTANQLRLYWSHRLAIVTVAAIATSIDFPDGLELALMLELAKLLHGPFGKTWTSDQDENRRMALADYQSINPGSEPPRIATTVGGSSLTNFLTRNY